MANRVLSFLCVVALFASLSSCSNDDTVILEPYYDVSFSLSGDYVHVSQEPLTRAESGLQSYYAINIYKKTSSKDEIFAYGVFTSLDGVSLRLPSDNLYKFECTLVKEQTDRIAIKSENGEKVLGYPFVVGTSSKNVKNYPIASLNQFTSSNADYLVQIGNGKSTVVTGDIDADGVASKTTDRVSPRLMRYYGELDNFSAASGKAEIRVLCTSFGVRIDVEVLPDGELTWGNAFTIDFGIEGIDYSAPTITQEGVSVTRIFTLDNVKSYWSSPNQECNEQSIKFTWKRPSGLATTFTYDFVPQRNVMSVLKVDLSEIGSATQIIVKEEDDMTEDVLHVQGN